MIWSEFRAYENEMMREVARWSSTLYDAYRIIDAGN